jgi:hypothetical protein
MTKLPQALIQASVPDLERFDLRAPLLRCCAAMGDTSG